MRSKKDIAMIICFLCLLLGIGGATLLLPDRAFSENENRALQQKPEISGEAVLSGAFESDLEQYMSDQLVGRDGWVAARSELKVMAGNRDLGGVYLGEGGYLIEKTLPEDVERETWKKNLAAVNVLFQRLSGTLGKEHLSFLLVPTAGYSLADRLPAHATVFSQEAVMEAAQALRMDGVVPDLRGVLTDGERASYYYKTDHHWTSKGAFRVYEAWCRAMGYEALPEESFQRTVVSDQFLGTLYSKTLRRNTEADSVEIYESTTGGDVLVDYGSKRPDADSFFDEAALEGKDKYKVFLGGNEAEIRISTGKAAGGHLLVLKDSYANCFVPFAGEHFAEVTLLDLRYFNGSVNRYVEENGVTDVLVLYNVSSFAVDKNLKKCIK